MGVLSSCSDADIRWHTQLRTAQLHFLRGNRGKHGLKKGFRPKPFVFLLCVHKGRFTVALWTSGQKIEMNRDKPAALRASDCLLDSKLLRKVKLVVVVSGSATRSQNICEQAIVSVSLWEPHLGLNGTPLLQLHVTHCRLIDPALRIFIEKSWKRHFYFSPPLVWFRVSGELRGGTTDARRKAKTLQESLSKHTYSSPGWCAWVYLLSGWWQAQGVYCLLTRCRGAISLDQARETWQDQTETLSQCLEEFH